MITGDPPKTAFLSIACALARLRWTFAVQQRLLALIFFHVVINPIGARILPGNLLIVHLFLNSPDFRLREIL